MGVSGDGPSWLTLVDAFEKEPNWDLSEDTKWNLGLETSFEEERSKLEEHDWYAGLSGERAREKADAGGVEEHKRQGNVKGCPI